MRKFTSKFILISIMLFLTSGLKANEWHWVKQMGDEHNDVGWNNAVDENGNNYAAGYFQGSMTFGNTTITSAGDYDGYVAKYDSQGNAQWAIKIGGQELVKVTAVDLDNEGNVYIVGHFGGDKANFQSTDGPYEVLYSIGHRDAFVAKYNPSGVLQWLKQIGHEQGPGEYYSSFLNSIDVTEDGYAHIVGRFWGKTQVGDIELIAEHYGDGYFAKYSPEGEVLWAEQTHTSYDGRGYGIAVDNQGDVFVNGDFKGTITFEEESFECYDNNDEEDVFLAKYDSNGEYIWAKQIGGEGEDVTWNLNVDGEGNCYTLAHFLNELNIQDEYFETLGSYDIILAKYASDGTPQWVVRDGGNGYDMPYQVHTTDAGMNYVVGNFSTDASFGDTTITSINDTDGFISVYDSDGDFQKVVQLGGQQSQTVHALGKDSEGNEYVYGYFQGSLVVGDETYWSYGWGDAFSIKMEIELPNQPETGMLSGTVTDAESGESISGAVITAGDFYTTSSSDGSYSMEVEEGTYTVICSADNYNTSESDVNIISNETVTQDFTLEPVELTGSLSGIITDAQSAEPIEGALVSAGSYSASSGSDGSYSIQDIPTGEYTVTCSVDNYQTDENNVSIVSNETVIQDFALEPLELNGTLTGIITDNETGEPIVGAQIEAGSYSATSDSDGNYIIAEMAAGAYTVTCIADYYTPAENDITIVEDETATLNFNLEPLTDPGTLTGTVKDNESDEPIEGAEITAGSYTAVSNSEGNYSIDEIAAGEYTVVCTAEGYLNDQSDIVIENGETVYQHFSMDAVSLPEPQNLSAEIFEGNDVALEWEEPQPDMESLEVSHDDGTNESMFDVGNATGNERVAVKFTPDQEVHLDSIKLYISAQTNFAQDITFNVLSDNNGQPNQSNVIGGPYVTSYTPDLLGVAQWHTFDIENLVLPAGETYYIEAIYTTSNNYKIGLDATDPDPCSFYSMDSGNSWMPAPDMDFMIRSIVLAEPSGNNQNELLGYNIYCNGSQINDEPITATSFNDTGLTNGAYEYYATAVYNQGESNASNHDQVEINYTPDLYPPSNLTTEVFGKKNVQLSWGVPAPELESMELAHDDGSNESMFDVGYATGSERVAVEFVPAQEVHLDSIKLYISAQTNFAQEITFNILGANNGQPDQSNVIGGPYVTSYTPDLLGVAEWHTFDVENLILPAGESYFIEAVYTSSNNYEIGLDASDPDPYSFYSMDSGNSWMSAPDMDIMIRSIVLANPEGKQVRDSKTENLLGYNIYRNGEQVNDEPITDTSYRDLSLYSGNYQYCVNAVYDLGESVTTDTAEVNIEKYFDFVGGDPSDDVWTIYLPKVQLEGEDLERGDEIAIYDGQTMVGTFELTEICNIDNQWDNYITAFSKLEGGDGYTPGHEISLKCYDASQQIQSDYAEKSFEDPYGDAWTQPEFPENDGEYSITAMNFLTITIHDIELHADYQFVSSYVETENNEMDDVLSDLMNNQSLGFVRNSDGDMFRKIGSQWVNNIGNWNIKEGYLFKMNESDELVMEGDAIDPETPIALESGHQFISYLMEYPADAQEAVESILDNLVFIRNSQGQSLRKIDGEWVNNIGNMKPGEGYLVHMENADELIYNINAGSKMKSSEIKTRHFAFGGGNPADFVYNIYIDPGESISVGDEVAAYDNGKLVGTTTIRSKNYSANSLPVFTTLSSGDGYYPGDNIKLKLWDASKDSEKDLEFKMIADCPEAYTGTTYPEEDGRFSIANIRTKSSGFENQSQLNIKVYPIPAKEYFVLECSKTPVIFTLTGIGGDVIIRKQVTDEKHVIKTSNLSAGVYMLRVQTDNKLQTHKLIVK